MKKRILFLQGPTNAFFTRIGRKMIELGHEVMAINLCLGDWIFWRGENTVNYKGSFAEWPEYIAKFLDENKITDILLSGEQRPYHKQAIAAAKEQGVRVVVTDFGYLRPDWINFEYDGMSGASIFPRDPEQIKRLAAQSSEQDFARRYRDDFWKMTALDMAYHFSQFFLFWFFPQYQPYQRENPLLFYPGNGLRLLLERKNKKLAEQQFSALRTSGANYFVFPLQMESDFQITAYSPFNNLREPLRQVIKSFAENADQNAQLIVKVHPWDPGLRNWRKLVGRIAAEYGVAERVGYYDGGNLDEMIKDSTGMVTVNSTCGMHALQQGKPVKVLGEAIFDIPGLTAQYELDLFWQNPPEPEAELLTAFIKALAATVHIRGVYFGEPGLSAAVEAAVERLSKDKINQPL